MIKGCPSVLLLAGCFLSFAAWAAALTQHQTGKATKVQNPKRFRPKETWSHSHRRAHKNAHARVIGAALRLLFRDREWKKKKVRFHSRQQKAGQSSWSVRMMISCGHFFFFADRQLCNIRVCSILTRNLQVQLFVNCGFFRCLYKAGWTLSHKDLQKINYFDVLITS